MLVQLSIRDIVLIERLDLEFEAGLSVLTGETGAGKSILLDSLSLALGGRGDGSLVRQGADKGHVTAVFDVAENHPVRALIRDNSLDADGDVVLRRVQNADGRTRVFINDQPTSVAMMRDVGHLLVEIHGQHDDRALVDADAHRTLLDAFAGLSDDVVALADLHGAWKEAERNLKRQREKVEHAARESDWLRASVEELERLHPVEGEEEELADRRATMMKAEKIAADINEAEEILSGQASPMPVISSLLRRMERKVQEAPELMSETVAALDRTLNALADAQSAVETARRAADFDPRELETTEERLFALRAAGRKFNVAVDDLSELAATMVSDLADIDAGEERLAALESRVEQCRASFLHAARSISERRQNAAGALKTAVMAELPALKLELAEFIVQMESNPEKAGVTGIDVVEFHVRTNPGTRAGPIMKVASGGELSRFLLALKVALADRGSAPTLVFDEIDTGVGGAVADAIGQRLKRLSETVQVLSVTHAPQVAARAARHFLIAKGPSKANGQATAVSTRVETMNADGRREEIARMLAGASVTEEARAAAARLLSSEG